MADPRTTARRCWNWIRRRWGEFGRLDIDKRLNLIASAVIAFATTVYAIVASCQLSTMNRALIETRRQADSANRAVEAVEREQRADLTMSGIEAGKPELGKPLNVRVFFSNHGRLAAANVSPKGLVVVLPAPPPEELNEYPALPNPGKGVLGTGERQFSWLETLPVKKSHADDIATKRGTLYALGRITYEDGFACGALYYCYQWLEPDVWLLCEPHNRSVHGPCK